MPRYELLHKLEFKYEYVTSVASMFAYIAGTSIYFHHSLDRCLLLWTAQDEAVSSDNSILRFQVLNRF